MDKDTIQQIAAQVVAQLPLGLLMIVNVVIAALVSALTALGVSYFRTRGQNLATKHDFEELQKQLKANTELVEAIKSEVSQRDWTQREWTTLRRIKLEALLEKTHECEVYLDRQRDSAFEGKIMMPERDPIGELETLATLYFPDFPELKSEVERLVSICRQYFLQTHRLAMAVQQSGNNQTAKADAQNNFLNTYDFRDFRNFQNTVTVAARSVLERIMNVDEGPAQSDER
jgi:hypothetical protein